MQEIQTSVERLLGVTITSHSLTFFGYLNAPLQDEGVSDHEKKSPPVIGN
jgi:hypothetical protein